MSFYETFLRAAKRKDVDTLRKLLETNPDHHNIEGDEGSLLDILFEQAREHFETVFQTGLSPDSGPANPLQTLLQRAAAAGDVDLVRRCIEHGANIERRNCNGETALGYAASWGTLECVKTLVEAGADINALEGPSGEPFSTALDVAHSGDPLHNRASIFSYLRGCGGKLSSELTPDGAKELPSGRRK